MTAMTNDTHPPNTPTTQGERLKQLRKSLGLSAQALADKLNAHGASVSRGAIANWECDKNGITSSKIPIVAQVLGTTENYLLTGNISTNPTVNNASQEIDLQDNLPNSHNHSHKVSLMKPLKKSAKLSNVCYDIRGELLQTANRMEAEGQRIIKLNIGNPEPFRLLPPDEIVQDVAMNLQNASGYSDSKGIFRLVRRFCNIIKPKDCCQRPMSMMCISAMACRSLSS